MNKKRLVLATLAVLTTLSSVSGSFAQGYYRQEQDRERAYRDKQDLRQDYRERNQATRRYQWDAYRERKAEARGDWRAARYYSHREDADARRVRKETRDIAQDRRDLNHDRARCYHDGTRC